MAQLAGHNAVQLNVPAVLCIPHRHLCTYNQQMNKGKNAAAFHRATNYAHHIQQRLLENPPTGVVFVAV
jgi:hypothetical protein